MTDTDRQATGGAIDHEIDSRSIVKIGVWLAVVTIAGFLVAWGVYRGLASLAAEADPAPSPIAAARVESLPPAVQLSARPEQELAEYRKEVDERLSSWGWVDRDANLAHVPIERAIELVAADAAPTPDAPTEEAAGAE